MRRLRIRWGMIYICIHQIGSTQKKNQGLVVNLYMYTSNWFPRLISSSAALQVTYDAPEIGWHWGPRSGDAVGHLDVHEPWTDQHQSGCM